MVCDICMYFIDNISYLFYTLYNKLFVSCNVLLIEANVFRLFFNDNNLLVVVRFSDMLCWQWR